MQKMMFNDQYGLTEAVLDGSKSMARRIAIDINTLNQTDKIWK